MRSGATSAATSASSTPMSGSRTCVASAAPSVSGPKIGREPRDLDLYVAQHAMAASIESGLRSRGWVLAQCAPVVSTWKQGSKIVQVVRTEHQSPVDCIARFDLTVCCAAFDLLNTVSYSSTAFSADLSARRLTIHNPAFPVDTLRRVSVLLDQGYRIDGAQLLKLHSLILADIHSQKIKAYRFGEVA